MGDNFFKKYYTNFNIDNKQIRFALANSNHDFPQSKSKNNWFNFKLSKLSIGLIIGIVIASILMFIGCICGCIANSHSQRVMP